jgi:hypothetical protein
MPSVPKDVAVQAPGAGTLMVECAASVHATHYRFFTQRDGVDKEPVFAGRSAAPLIELKGLTAGETV